MTDINKINSGIDTTFSTKLNANLATSLRASGQNIIQQLEDRGITLTADGGVFAEAYPDSNGRNNDVDTGATSSIFDTDKYTSLTSSTEPFVIIEATAIPSPSDFEINDCKIIEVESGKWQLTCTSGTDEVKRAQIYKTLFFDARASPTYISGISALKTSVSRDVGKQAHYMQYVLPNSDSFTNSGNLTVDWTFDNTSTNDDCSFWGTSGNTTPSLNQSVQFPIGTEIYTQNTSGTTDETGTDTSGDENDNPGDMRFRWQTSASGGTGTGNNTKGFVLCVGGLGTASVTNPTDIANGTLTEIDFNVDNGIPLFTATTESVESQVTHNIPSGTFSATLSTAFMTSKLEDWESGADVQYKLQNPVEDTNINDTTEYNGVINETVEYGAYNSTTSEFTTEIKNSAGDDTTLAVYFNYKDGTTGTGTGGSGTDSTSYVSRTFTNPNPSKLLDNITFLLSFSTGSASTVYMKNNAATLTAGATQIDSGWLNSNEVVSFTPFTVEPDLVVVKLIPKTTSPTAGYPSINGIALYGDRP